MARLALRKLELSPAEVRRGIDAALALPRAEPWTAEELVREVLRSTG